MRKYCRKMKKRRVSFSLFHANDVGNTEALLSILWASVVQRCSFRCRPLACGRVSTGQCTCFHRPVDRADALLFQGRRITFLFHNQ